MNLLNLPTDALIFNALGLLVCVTIMITCVCRLNVMEGMPLRLTIEQVKLIAFALWAAGTAGDLWSGHTIGIHGAAGGFGILLYLYLSFRQWKLQSALLKEHRERGDELGTIPDCSAGSPCTNCAFKETCGRLGCVRMASRVAVRHQEVRRGPLNN